MARISLDNLRTFVKQAKLTFAPLSHSHEKDDIENIIDPVQSDYEEDDENALSFIKNKPILSWRELDNYSGLTIKRTKNSAVSLINYNLYFTEDFFENLDNLNKIFYLENPALQGYSNWIYVYYNDSIAASYNIKTGDYIKLSIVQTALQKTIYIESFGGFTANICVENDGTITFDQNVAVTTANLLYWINTTTNNDSYIPEKDTDIATKIYIDTQIEEKLQNSDNVKELESTLNEHIDMPHVYTVNFTQITSTVELVEPELVCDKEYSEILEEYNKGSIIVGSLYTETGIVNGSISLMEFIESENIFACIFVAPSSVLCIGVNSENQIAFSKNGYLDSNLTTTGLAADAGAVGKKINELKSYIDTNNFFSTKYSADSLDSIITQGYYYNVRLPEELGNINEAALLVYRYSSNNSYCQVLFGRESYNNSYKICIYVRHGVQYSSMTSWFPWRRISNSDDLEALKTEIETQSNSKFEDVENNIELINNNISSLQTADEDTNNALTSLQETFEQNISDLENANTTASNRLNTIEDKILKLNGAMHFKGVLSSIPEDISSYEAGDTIIVGNKEFVFDGTEFKEFGDVTEETQRISLLETATETLQNSAHTHSNKDELDKITSGNVDTWNRTLSQAKIYTDDARERLETSIEEVNSEVATRVKSDYFEEVMENKVDVNQGVDNASKYLIVDPNGNVTTDYFDGIIVKSSTAGSTKLFKITVNDSGTLSVKEFNNEGTDVPEIAIVGSISSDKDITLSGLPTGTYTLKYEDSDNNELDSFDIITEMEV